MIKKHTTKPVAAADVIEDENDVDVITSTPTVKKIKPLKKMVTPVDDIEAEVEETEEDAIEADETEYETDDTDVEADETEYETDDTDVEVEEETETEEEEEEEPTPKKTVKKPTKKVVEEEEETEDDSEYEEAEEDPLTKKAKKGVKKTATVKVEEPLTKAREFAKAAKDVSFGPSKGRRLYDEKFNETETTDTTSANKDANLTSFVNQLEQIGLNFIFDGCKFATEKKVIASAIMEAYEKAMLDCIFNVGTGWAMLSGRADATYKEGKFSDIIKGSKMKNPTIKPAHHVITLKNCEFEKGIGLIYRNENNSSELSVPVEVIEEGKTAKVLADGITLKKGDIVNMKGRKMKKKK